MNQITLKPIHYKAIRWARRNPIDAGLLAIGALSLLASLPAMGRSWQNLETQRMAIQRAAVAEQRISDGAVPVVLQGSYVSLQENRPVLDPTTQQPIPSGMFVRDYNGNTCVMAQSDPASPPVCTDLAWTGNSDLINQGLKK